MRILKRFWTDESGATVIEYTLIVAFIAVVTVVAMIQVGDSIGDNLNAIFEEV